MTEGFYVVLAGLAVLILLGGLTIATIAVYFNCKIQAQIRGQLEGYGAVDAHLRIEAQQRDRPRNADAS
jgi:hypothetical protein